MLWLGMCALGAFVGYVVTFGLVRITDWSKPLNVISGILSAVVGGSIFLFIERMGGDHSALALYPIGLAYGALCTNMPWVAGQLTTPLQKAFAILHVAAFGVATAFLFLLFLSPQFRALLP